MSLLQEDVIKISLQGSLFRGSPPRVWDEAPCVLFNRSLQRGSFMTGYLTTRGRWKAGLLRICSGAGGGVGMCAPFCVRAPVPETDFGSDFPHVRTLGSDSHGT